MPGGVGGGSREASPYPDLKTCMYLSKSNFIFLCRAPTDSQERVMKKHMLKYILSLQAAFWRYRKAGQERGESL